MSAWARPGVKCVCVDGAPRQHSATVLPKEGATYTIASVEWCVWMSGEEGLGVHVAEINRPKHRSGKVFPWDIARFRPLITQQDDVALFTHLLTGTPVRELVE